MTQVYGRTILATDVDFVRVKVSDESIRVLRKLSTDADFLLKAQRGYILPRALHDSYRLHVSVGRSLDGNPSLFLIKTSVGSRARSDVYDDTPVRVHFRKTTLQ